MPPKPSASEKVPPPRRRKPLSEVLDDDTGSSQTPSLSVPEKSTDSTSPQLNPLKKAPPPPPPKRTGGRTDNNVEPAAAPPASGARPAGLQQTPLQAAAKAGKELPNGLVNTPRTPAGRNPPSTRDDTLSADDEDGNDPSHFGAEVRSAEGEDAVAEAEEEEPVPMDHWRSPCYDCRNYIRPMICEAWMCHPCNVAFQLAAVQDNWKESEVNPVPCLGVIVFDVMACGLGSVLSSFFLRRQVKAKFDIGEELYAEIGIGCCCAPCSLAQTDRELRIRGQPPHTAWFEMPSLTKMASYRPPRGRTGKGPASPPQSGAPRPAPRR